MKQTGQERGEDIHVRDRPLCFMSSRKDGTVFSDFIVKPCQPHPSGKRPDITAVGSREWNCYRLRIFNLKGIFYMLDLLSAALDINTQHIKSGWKLFP